MNQDVATVFAIFTLEAAHRLENVPKGHKCRRTHGHTYEVRIEVIGPVREHLGWVIDYYEIEQAWTKRVHDLLDHRHLNKVKALRHLKGNTTSENLAKWIRSQVSIGLELAPLDNLAVEVWETATCGARVG